MALSPPSSGRYASSPESVWLVGEALVAETIDRGLATNSGAPASGSLRGGPLALRAGQTVTSLLIVVNGAGAGMTHGQLALYDLAGNLLRSTADSPATFQASGLKTLALSSPYTAPVDQVVYAACWLTTGTTMPTLWSILASSTDLTQQLGGGAFRAVSQAGLAALPNPAVFAGATTLFWIGAS